MTTVEPWTTPTLLAPMQGVGAKGVRDLLTHLGRPGMVCTPFLRITAHSPSIPWLIGHIEHSFDVPLSVQLLGNHAQHLALAAAALSEAGADVVDLNLGCPSRQVNKKCAGAALLANLDDVTRIVSSMRDACPGRMSVKMRAFEDAPESTIRIAQAIEAAGADYLTLHPRTRAQGYQGVADWSLVKQVKAQLRIPVVGNGDCWYAADVLRLMRATRVDAVMIGRPALRNPFIFRQVRELLDGTDPFVPSGHDVFLHIERLTELFVETLSDTRRGPGGALKEQIQYLMRSVPEPERSQLWLRTMRANSLEEISEAIRPLEAIERLDLTANGPMRFEPTPSDP